MSVQAVLQREFLLLGGSAKAPNRFLKTRPTSSIRSFVTREYHKQDGSGSGGRSPPGSPRDPSQPGKMTTGSDFSSAGMSSRMYNALNRRTPQLVYSARLKT
jgi:hypothetical protein